LFHISGGAYLFLPDGKPMTLNTNRYNEIRIVKGPLVEEVTVILPSLVQRTARIYKNSGDEFLLWSFNLWLY
jgi:hypothetical protein